LNLAQALAAGGIEPREARLLLAEATGLSAAGVLAHGERELAEATKARYLEMVARRKEGEPIAYILGRREFYGLSLAVGPSVLIPRPETELLVELALERLPLEADTSVADLGTGCGAIALAIKKHRPRARVVAIDESVAALEVAARNAAQHALEVDWRHGRWFEATPAERFDLIVSNPPYVAAGDPHLSMGDVRFEPPGALVAGSDGLDAIRAIVRDAPAFLREGAWLLLEHGETQDVAVRELLLDAGMGDVATWPDLAAIARVSGGKLKSD
jgi:release factor glutamine methyltransferase